MGEAFGDLNATQYLNENEVTDKPVIVYPNSGEAVGRRQRRTWIGKSRVVDGACRRNGLPPAHASSADAAG